MMLLNFRSGHRLATVLMLAAAAAAAACGDDDPSGPEVVEPIDVAIPATSQTVAAMEDISFELPTGTAIDASLTEPVTVTFPSASSFAVSSASGAAEGNLTFGSCIITWTESSFAPGQGPQVGGTATISPCNINIGTSDDTQIGGSNTGTVTLTLGTTESAPQAVQVEIRANLDGSITVVVNGEPVATGRPNGPLTGSG